MSARLPVKTPSSLPADFFALAACGLLIWAGYKIYEPLAIILGSGVCALVSGLLIRGQWRRRR